MKFNRFFLNEAQKTYEGYYLFTKLLKITKEINCTVVTEGVETEVHINCVSRYNFFNHKVFISPLVFHERNLRTCKSVTF